MRHHNYFLQFLKFSRYSRFGKKSGKYPKNLIEYSRVRVSRDALSFCVSQSVSRMLPEVAYQYSFKHWHDIVESIF